MTLALPVEVWDRVMGVTAQPLLLRVCTDLSLLSDRHPVYPFARRGHPLSFLETICQLCDHVAKADMLSSWLDVLGHGCDNVNWLATVAYECWRLAPAIRAQLQPCLHKFGKAIVLPSLGWPNNEYLLLRFCEIFERQGQTLSEKDVLIMCIYIRGNNMLHSSHWEDLEPFLNRIYIASLLLLGSDTLQDLLQFVFGDYFQSIF